MTRGPGRHSERNFRAAEQHYYYYYYCENTSSVIDSK